MINLPISSLRLCTAELLAYAVIESFPDVKLLGAEFHEQGFWYSFIFPNKVNREILTPVEDKMRSLIKEEIKVQSKEMMRTNAIEFFEHHHQNHKADSLKKLDTQMIDMIQIGDFLDHCPGPHITNTSSIHAFKILGITEEIENNLNITVIHGTAFFNRQELKKFLKTTELAKKHDHRTLGKELELFTSFKEGAAGTWTWLPKGALIRDKLLDKLKKDLSKEGCLPVYSQQMVNPNFLHRMKIEKYAHLTVDGTTYGFSPPLSAMHAKIFDSKFYSYKHLPKKFYETACMTIEKKRSILWGLFECRSFTEECTTVFCTEEQFLNECIKSLQFFDKTVNMLGFEYRWILSKRGAKFAGTIKQWEKYAQLIQEALTSSKFQFNLDMDEYSFVGPKVIAMLTDHLGREWYGPSITVDLNIPERFGLKYQGKDDEMHSPVMITRSTYGSIERFVAILVEHYAGRFPLWLSPEQVRVIPVKERNNPYAEHVKEQIANQGFRVTLDARRDTLSSRVHLAEKQKVPNIVAIGDQEEKHKTMTLRSRSKIGKKEFISLEEFLKNLREESKIEE